MQRAWPHAWLRKSYECNSHQTAHLHRWFGRPGSIHPYCFNRQRRLESSQEPINDPQGSIGGGWQYSGQNLHFGIREHGMGAIYERNGCSWRTIPFGSTFLIFSDYMRPSIRLAALMGLHVIYVFTHDSLAVGEDGPTHEPVEQLLGCVPSQICLLFVRRMRTKRLLPGRSPLNIKTGR